MTAGGQPAVAFSLPRDRGARQALPARRPSDLVINGSRGDDVAVLGAGDDTFIWNPGDGSDTVEGQAGSDTMLFNGANIAEKIVGTANSPRVRFTRAGATLVMDLNGAARVDFNA